MLIIAAPASLAQSGGGYDLRWSEHTAGGGQVNGANGYALTGTIARVDANAHGPMSGAGNYALNGGFWAGVHEGSDVIFRSGFEGVP